MSQAKKRNQAKETTPQLQTMLKNPIDIYIYIDYPIGMQPATGPLRSLNLSWLLNNRHTDTFHDGDRDEDEDKQRRERERKRERERERQQNIPRSFIAPPPFYGLRTLIPNSGPAPGCQA